MSWYVDYYIGYRTKEGKIYPLGHYDCFGNLHSVLTKSRSFASDLWERFDQITLEETTDEIRRNFPKGNIYSWEPLSDEEAAKLPPWCFWMYLKDLPKGSYFKQGYFLQEDISAYERDEGYFDGFYHMLTAAEYARKMEAELKFGVPKPKKDEEGNEEVVYSCGEYSFYIYPDYDSQEYEAAEIRSAAETYEYMSDLPKDSELVVLQTNG